MENITLEKVIEFNSLIDSIDYIEVKENNDYKIDEDNFHANGLIEIKGKVITIDDKIDFEERVDVDIYAPYEKKIDSNNFKLDIVDYSYKINGSNLIVYLVVSIKGLVENKIEDSSLQHKNCEIIDKINNINEIKEEVRNKAETKIIENENNIENKVSSNWANDIFALTENKTTFIKIKLNSENND